ncbi:hypothetical protein [Trabulsiella odontotermitis]|uniref:hypothetical protein n=1 Tax=Trabulsiella odontotermitis TaxID=379893 RepID=UPI000B26BA55|nr:hypothetical protein [Trabulsiella odontotermitis]
MMLAALEHALKARAKVVLLSGAGIVVLILLGWLKLSLMADPATAAAGLMLWITSSCWRSRSSCWPVRPWKSTACQHVWSSWSCVGWGVSAVV